MASEEPAFDPELYFNKIPPIPKEEVLQLDENGELIEKKRKGKEKFGKDKKARTSDEAPPPPVVTPKPGNIFVTGLPKDISLDDIAQYFGKCGIIKKDPETAEYKVKMYEDEAGTFKGEALISYYRPESVQLAITILDGSEISPGYVIKVQEASFEHKGKKKKGGKKRIPKGVKVYDQSKALSWEEDESTRVIIKNMFTQEEAWQTPNFFKELQEDLTTECNKFGEVEKIKIFERNPEGVVAVKFKLPYAASRCLDKMNGRFFGGKKLTAEFYDGWSNYHVEETEEQREQRLNAWSKWLEDEDEENEQKVDNKTPSEKPQALPETQIEVENVVQAEESEPANLPAPKEVKDAPKSVLDFGTLVAPTRRRHRDEDEELEQDD